MQQAHHNEAPKPSNPGTQGVKRDRERPKGSKDKRPHVRSDDLIVNSHRIVRCTSTERFFELLEDSPAFNMHDSQLESKKERLQHAAANIGTVSTDDYDHDYSYDGPKAEGLESVLLMKHGTRFSQLRSAYFASFAEKEFWMNPACQKTAISILVYTITGTGNIKLECFYDM